MSENNILEVRDLKIEARPFGENPIPIVKGVSFDVKPGQVVALIGESGSGKTTISLAALGYTKPGLHFGGGEVLLQGEDMERVSDERKRQLRGENVAYLAQSAAATFNPAIKIGEQVTESAVLHGAMDQDEADKRATELYHALELPDPELIGGRYPHQVSGGQLQRLMAAMALVSRPSLLVLDEPTTALDVTIRQQVMELLYSIQETKQMSILLITHDLPLVESFAERVGVMKNGEMIECERKKDLFARPQHEYTRLLLNSRPTALNAPYQKREVLLEARNISCFYKIKKSFFTSKKMYPVSDQSFVIYKGETLGVVGESGSGKTSLGMALLRLFAGHSYGTLRFGSEEYSSMGRNNLFKLRRKIQMVFQDPFSSLSPRMTIFEILEEGLSLHFPSMSNSDKKKKCRNVIEEVGLSEDHLERYPHQFSAGQRQRISLARALVIEPELLVLDEPTSALDVSVQKQIIDLLLNLQRERKLTYFFISHDLAVIRALAHRLLVMRYGKVLEFGLTSHVLSQPKHDYTCSLLDAAFAHERA